MGQSAGFPVEEPKMVWKLLDFGRKSKLCMWSKGMATAEKCARTKSKVGENILKSNLGGFNNDETPQRGNGTQIQR